MTLKSSSGQGLVKQGHRTNPDGHDHQLGPLPEGGQNNPHSQWLLRSSKAVVAAKSPSGLEMYESIPDVAKSETSESDGEDEDRDAPRGIFSSKVFGVNRVESMMDFLKPPRFRSWT